jgi:hypothetical protein
LRHRADFGWARRAMSAQTSRITPESKCVGCDGIGSALSVAEVHGYKSLIPGWDVDASCTRLSKRLRVKNFSVRLSGLSHLL